MSKFEELLTTIGIVPAAMCTMFDPSITKRLSHPGRYILSAVTTKGMTCDALLSCWAEFASECPYDYVGDPRAMTDAFAFESIGIDGCECTAISIDNTLPIWLFDVLSQMVRYVVQVLMFAETKSCSVTDGKGFRIWHDAVTHDAKAYVLATEDVLIVRYPTHEDPWGLIRNFKEGSFGWPLNTSNVQVLSIPFSFVRLTTQRDAAIISPRLSLPIFSTSIFTLPEIDVDMTVLNQYISNGDAFILSYWLNKID